MDEREFAAIAERHRRELQIHCYELHELVGLPVQQQVPDARLGRGLGGSRAGDVPARVAAALELIRALH